MGETDEQAWSAAMELDTLCATLQLDAPVVRRFIADYLVLLDVRIQRIERDLDGGNVSSASVGLLSLATSSSMLGAVGIAEAADQLLQGTATGNQTSLAAGRLALHSQATHEHRRLREIHAAGAGGLSA